MIWFNVEVQTKKKPGDLLGAGKYCILTQVMVTWRYTQYSLSYILDVYISVVMNYTSI